MEALLRREAHIQSIDLPDEILAKRPGDKPVTEEEVRKATSYHALNSTQRTITNLNLEEIQAHCERRRIMPHDKATRDRLRAAEESRLDLSGPASVAVMKKPPPKKTEKQTGKKRIMTDGVYDMEQYADILSSAHSSTVPADANTIDDLHTHEKMETRCYQLVHRFPDCVDNFHAHPMYTTTLVSRSEELMGSVMQMPQYENCETLIDKFRDEHAHGNPLRMKFGEFLTLFAEECGLKLFCAYVIREYKNNIFAAFELDASRRYFLLVVFFVDAAPPDERGNPAPVTCGTIDIIPTLVRSWHEEAMDSYNVDLNTPERAPNTYRPCSELEVRTSDYWALYSIFRSKRLQEQKVAFQYAYYTTCQCIELK